MIHRLSSTSSSMPSSTLLFSICVTCESMCNPVLDASRQISVHHYNQLHISAYIVYFKTGTGSQEHYTCWKIIIFKSIAKYLTRNATGLFPIDRSNMKSDNSMHQSFLSHAKIRIPSSPFTMSLASLFNSMRLPCIGS